MTEKLEMRVYGDASLPTIIYLPGLHGDWTLIGSLRRALAGRVRFVETTYPRAVTWSLDDYAAGVETALAEHAIPRGWLLGESFSSQVVWALLARSRFPAQAVILAGGFVRHPMRWAARTAEAVGGAIPRSLLTRVLFGYAMAARFRYRHSPETLANINEFVARRTEPDRQAAMHRLELIARNDPSAIVRQVRLPVYALSGLLDPVVPWLPVRRWLRRNCPSLREYRILAGADHNVLSTAPDAAAEVLVRWIREAGVLTPACAQGSAAQPF
jgi:pimeloyl-ACP methyl ester carboxylesterase